jgi:hypothetical protein
MKAPILNPIRFYSPANNPDYISHFPNMDNVQQRVENIPGVYPTMWYKEWLVNKKMILEFTIEDGDSTDLLVFKYNETTLDYDQIMTIAGTNHTPTGWQGLPIRLYEFTPSNAGTYLFSFYSGLNSDKFIVVDDSLLKKKLVEISYSNSENDFGVIVEAYESSGIILQTSNFTPGQHMTFTWGTHSVTFNCVGSEPGPLDFLATDDLRTVLLKSIDLNDDYEIGDLIPEEAGMTVKLTAYGVGGNFNLGLSTDGPASLTWDPNSFDIVDFAQYFTGNLKIGSPENVMSVFPSDRYELTKLRSTPVRVMTLVLPEVHYTYVDHITELFGLDYLIINGIEIQTTDPPTITEIENSDLVDIEIKCVQKNNDYYYK